MGGYYSRWQGKWLQYSNLGWHDKEVSAANYKTLWGEFHEDCPGNGVLCKRQHKRERGQQAADFFNFHWWVHFLLVIKAIGLTISIFLSVSSASVIPCTRFRPFCIHSGSLIIPTVHFFSAVCISCHPHKLTFCLSCYTRFQMLPLCWPFLIFSSLHLHCRVIPLCYLVVRSWYQSLIFSCHWFCCAVSCQLHAISPYSSFNLLICHFFVEQSHLPIFSNTASVPNVLWYLMNLKLGKLIELNTCELDELVTLGELTLYQQAE